MSDSPAALAPNVKPPLSGRLKASAVAAGILGFLLLTIGWTLVVLAVTLGSLVAGVGVLAAQQSSSASGEVIADLLRVVARTLAVGAIPLVVTGVVGAVLWVLGLFISRGILRRGGHHRPWAITWSAFGIAILLSLVVGAVGAVIGGVVTPMLTAQIADQITRTGAAPTADAFRPLVIEAIVYVAAGLVLTVLIGWLSWSLMARAFRPTAQQLADRERIHADRAASLAHRDRVRADAAARGVSPAEIEREERHAEEHPPRHEAPQSSDG